MNEQLPSPLASTPATSPSSPPAMPQGAPSSLSEQHGHYDHVAGVPGDSDLGDSAIGRLEPGVPGGAQLPTERPGDVEGAERGALSSESVISRRVYDDDGYVPPEWKGGRFELAEVRKLEEILDLAAIPGRHVEASRAARDLAARFGNNIVRQVEQRDRIWWSRIKESLVAGLKAEHGNRLEIALGNAKFAFQSMLGLSPAEQSQLMAFWDASGVSSHPLMIKALLAVYERNREPEPVPPNPPGPRDGSGGRDGGRDWYSSVEPGAR